MAGSLVDGAVAHMSPDGSHVALPGAVSKHGAQSDGMEGFARTLLLHSFRLAGDPETAHRRHTDRYLEGLHNGLREGRNGSTWLPIADKGHAIPEAASIALALGVAPRSLWDPLDGEAQDRIVQWLSEAVAAQSYDNNWRLFAPVAGAFLNSIGVEAPGVREARSLALASLSTWETPDGWISDGDDATYDYYSSFALHFYPLMLAGVFGDEDFAARTDAARGFLATLPALIASDGAPVYFGRSLTYRFGVCAAMSAGAVADCLPWEPAAARELTATVVDYFRAHGAIAPDGTLPRGWFGEDPAIVQSYSGPASSYWASKAFANLLLAADHPYWSGPPAPASATRPLVLAGSMLAASRPGAEVVRLANHGSVSRAGVVIREEAEDPLYSRIEYSSASAPTASANARGGGLVIALRGGLAAPGPAITTGAGDMWVASRSAMRTGLASARPRARDEVLGKRSVRLEGHDALLATLAVNEWFVHVLYLPPRFPWRGDIRWAGLPVPHDPASSPVRRAGAASVSGGDLTSTIVGLLGVTIPDVERTSAPPFASEARMPIVSSRGIGRRGPHWASVATYFGPTEGSPETTTAPRVERAGHSSLLVTAPVGRWKVEADGSLFVSRAH